MTVFVVRIATHTFSIFMAYNNASVIKASKTSVFQSPSVTETYVFAL